MMASQFVIESIVRAVMKEMVRESQKGSLSQTKTLYIPTGVSNRHVHLSQEHANILFGKGKVFKKLRDLSQPGQCVYEETVNLAGPIGFFTNVRILGPVREQTQVELLAGDCIILGIDAPIRESGKLAESGGGLSITGPNGCVWLKEGVIIAKRHIHMHTTDAERFNVVDGEEVSIRVNSERSGILHNTVVRVSERFRLEFHVDFDEANAFMLKPGDLVTIEKAQS